MTAIVLLPMRRCKVPAPRGKQLIIAVGVDQHHEHSATAAAILQVISSSFVQHRMDFSQELRSCLVTTQAGVELKS
jgi:hypothetical protein